MQFEPRKRTDGFNNTYCSVPGCFSRADRNLTVRFHLFPKAGRTLSRVDKSGNLEDVDLRKIWTKKCGILRQISNFMRICSLHFTQDDYCFSKGSGGPQKRYLKKEAIPSANLPSFLTETGTWIPGGAPDFDYCPPTKGEKVMLHEDHTYCLKFGQPTGFCCFDREDSEPELEGSVAYIEVKGLPNTNNHTYGSRETTDPLAMISDEVCDIKLEKDGLEMVVVKMETGCDEFSPDGAHVN